MIYSSLRSAIIKNEDTSKERVQLRWDIFGYHAREKRTWLHFSCKKHNKGEKHKINKRHKQVNEKFTDLEEETIEIVTEEKVFTKCDFACIVKLQ